VSDRRGEICWQSAVCFVMVCPRFRAPHFASSRLRVRNCDFLSMGEASVAGRGGISGAVSPVPPPGTPCHAAHAGEALRSCWAHAKPRRRERKRWGLMRGERPAWWDLLAVCSLLRDRVSPFSVVCPRFRCCVPVFGAVSPASRLTMVCPPLRTSRLRVRNCEFLSMGEASVAGRGGFRVLCPRYPPPVPPATQCVQGRPLGTVGLTRRREDANGNAGGRCKVSDRRGEICWQSAVCS